MKIITILLILALAAGANSLPSEKRKNGLLIQQALAPVQVFLQESSAVFYSDENSLPFLYGTVVSEDGFILTKVSELDEVESYHVRIGSKKYRAPKFIGRNDVWDVGLVKIDAEGLRAVDMSSSGKLSHGTWIVSNGATDRRFRRPKPGIVSANQRKIPGGSPVVLGLALDAKEEGLLVCDVSKKSGAAEAGLKKDDVLLKIDSTVIEDRESFIECLSGKSPGESVKVRVKREDEILDFEVELKARHKVYDLAADRNVQLSGGPDKLSQRRTMFPMVIQHETMLDRWMVGGPVFTLDGVFKGMNIAVANRVEAFAIPSKELAEVLGELRDK